VNDPKVPSHRGRCGEQSVAANGLAVSERRQQAGATHSVALLCLGSATSAEAQAVASTEAFTAPFSLTLTPADYPCLQEAILIDGTLHSVVRVTLDANGGRQRATLINAQGLTGLGLTGGTVYQVSGPGHNTFSDDDLTPPVRERTFYDIIHVVGPDDATDLLGRAGVHLAFNSNGDLVAFTAVDSVRCN
jgi:hypothetical protein